MSPARLHPVVLAVLCALSASAFATEAPLSADAYVSTASPAANYGTTATLNVGAGASTLLRFDLSALPDRMLPANLLKANLLLYVNRIGVPGSVEVNALGSAWSENVVTAGNAPVTERGTSATTAAVTSAGQYIAIDVTDKVMAWIAAGNTSNFGFVIQASAGDPTTTVFFDSKENTGTGHAARLDLTMVNQGQTGAQGLAGLPGLPGLPGPLGLKGDAGATGPAGVIGATGPIGPTGPVGLTGAVGQTGSAGTTGATGPAGAPGAAGAIGPMGLTGMMGTTGAAGPVGSVGATGPAGAAGAAGLAGPAGAQGLKGDTGLSGATGATGAIGPAGSPGAAGVPGATGATGPAGALGAAGATGVTGAAGATGATGAIGPMGISGAAGPMGLAGATGAAGPAGNAGVAGPAGPAGTQGLKGDTGLTGTTGATGAVGSTGATGVTGVAGATGATGATGPAGAPGAAGAIGPTGLAGMMGTTGAAGPVGPAGATGPAGNTGATGATGTTGVAGIQGAIGPAGLQGATGPAGANGFNGSTGPTGPQGPIGITGNTGATGAAGPGVTWMSVAIATQAAPNTGYMATGSSQVIITLPVTSTSAVAVGAVFRVNGVGAGGWAIAQNTGQSTITKNIGTGTLATTTGLIKGAQYDAIELQYIGNNTFSVLNYVGTVTVPLPLPAGYVVQGGLTWMPVSNSVYTPSAASTLCAGTINGQTGWRLPTQPELSALYSSGAMNGQGWTLSFTWSSTPGGTGGHYFVSLVNGTFGSYSDAGGLYVTCVR